MHWLRMARKTHIFTFPRSVVLTWACPVTLLSWVTQEEDALIRKPQPLYQRIVAGGEVLSMLHVPLHRTVIDAYLRNLRMLAVLLLLLVCAATAGVAGIMGECVDR